MTPSLLGLHHVTAIADDPQRNVDFYTGVLGLRLVKVTVDVHDPAAYHLYYGNALGRPGTLLTFYCWPGAIRGRPGPGQVISTALAVSPTTLENWGHRLAAHGVLVDGPSSHAEVQVLSFRDPDGLALRLVAAPPVAPCTASTSGSRPNGLAIDGLYGITLWAEAPAPTEAFLTAALGLQLREPNAVGSVRCYGWGSDRPGTWVGVRQVPAGAPGLIAVGSVHHVGLRVLDAAALTWWRERLVALGTVVSAVQDHVYYQAISVTEPGGVRIELATDGPGMTVDESPAALGTLLALPPWLENRRRQLVRSLPPLRPARGDEQRGAGVVARRTLMPDQEHRRFYGPDPGSG